MATVTLNCTFFVSKSFQFHPGTAEVLGMPLTCDRGRSWTRTDFTCDQQTDSAAASA